MLNVTINRAIIFQEASQLCFTLSVNVSMLYSERGYISVASFWIGRDKIDIYKQTIASVKGIINCNSNTGST